MDELVERVARAICRGNLLAGNLYDTPEDVKDLVDWENKEFPDWNEDARFTVAEILNFIEEEKRQKVADIVAWMRKRAIPMDGDQEYDQAWCDGVREMAEEIEANEDEKCG